MTESIHVDLCIIGAGAAGLSVAAGAAQLGLHVALAEQGKMGGDCLNYGCIPSKALLAAAKAAQTARTAHKYGINVPEPDIDFRAVKKHITDVIKTIEPHDSQERFEGLGVRVFRGRARFIDKHTVQAGSKTIRARNFLIATGSRPVLPPIKGLDPGKTFTNETIFDLKKKPAHLVIIGAGPIGMELAQAHKRLGCKVTVLDIATALPKDDPAMVAIIKNAFQREYIRIIEKTEIMRIEHADEAVKLEIETGGHRETIEGTHLLAAAGRRANIDGLDLGNANIEHSDRGIKTDRRLRTSQKHIYAAGDVAGGPQFTHIAGYHAGIIIRNMVFKIPAKVNYGALPWVTYTDPELAQAGMTESMARQKYGDSIKISTWRFKENDRAQTDRRTEGGGKIIMRKNGTVIGASLAGANAGELITLWSLVISNRIKIGDVANMIAPYPTYSEISKRMAGAVFTDSLFSDKTRFITGLLQRLPF